MTRSGFNLMAVILVSASTAFAATNDLPKFEELYQLLRTNLGGLSETDLDHAATRGLLKELESQVALVNDSKSTPNTTEAPALSKAIILDNSFVYFRFGKIAGDLGDKFSSTLKQLSSTNKAKVKGIVLDLRFAGGSDYAAAAAVADRFLSSEQALLDWGTGSARATTKTNAITVPVAVLVNSQTTGAAEALAAILRDANVGLLLGNTTAGQASVFKEFSLANNEKVRIATAQIKLGNGQVLAHGLKPDIEIASNTEDEKAYLDDPYKVLRPVEVAKVTGSETNSNTSVTTNRTHRRYNEAELVRQQREGVDPEAGDNDEKRKREPEKPSITDPVLARALDLLKGLAVVQQNRPG